MEEVRKYHNLVKRQLIQSVTKKGTTILDVGCGCGGDLQKWKHCQVGVIDMCDPNSQSLADASKRAITHDMKVNFFEGDISACPTKIYNVICYNFSLHYIFQTKELFFKSIQSVRNRMKKGSFLIGCIPDSESIIMMGQKFNDEFGNTMIRSDKTGYGQFGEKLFVQLVDTPFYKDGLKAEPIAYKDLLVTHLEEYGLRLVKWESLRNFKISKLYSQFIFICN